MSIREANEKALGIINRARPTLIGLGQAGEVLEGLTPKTILHAGPPFPQGWEDMSGPVRGAIIGALLYEGWASSPGEGEELAASGSINFAPCHHYGAAGPMAGIISPSMPVWIVENKKGGNRAFSTINEGLGRVLRFGAYQEEVIRHLHWIKEELFPLLQETLGKMGEIDLKEITAQALQMGDECHNRNRAATSLLIRKLAPHIMRISPSREGGARVLEFLDSNDHFYLNLSMAACKASLDPILGLKECTLVAAMARNGTEFGIRVAGLGNRWFTAPAEIIDGLFFPGYSQVDANPDLGDSVISETAGIGGFAMAASPAIVQFVGGSAGEATHYTESMYEITVGESDSYLIPILDFRGTPTGIDVRRVVETGLLPVINTGIAHKKAGIGQIGAGLVRPPLDCFQQAVRALAEKYRP